MHSPSPCENQEELLAAISNGEIFSAHCGAEQLAHYDGEPFVEATDVEAIDPAPTPSASPA